MNANIKTNLKLLGEDVGDDCSQAGEKRGEEHTHISDVNGDM